MKSSSSEAGNDIHDENGKPDKPSIEASKADILITCESTLMFRKSLQLDPVELKRDGVKKASKNII